MLAGMLLGGCESQEQRNAELIETYLANAGARLRAAFSHLGLNTAWVLRGSETAVYGPAAPDRCGELRWRAERR